MEASAVLMPLSFCWGSDMLAAEGLGYKGKCARRCTDQPHHSDHNDVSWTLQVDQEGMTVFVENIASSVSTGLTPGSYVPPLAVSGGRQVAAVVSKPRRIFLFDLEEAC